MKHQLFLDCDGVLADFDSAAQKLFGMPPRLAEKKMGTSAFWTRIRHRPNFYRDLALMPDARELFDAVAHLNPVILTGCPRGGWAEPQKVEWAAEHFPGTRIITCLSADKRMHMHCGDVLVDDYLKYRDRWEEAGGTFIHHVSARSSIEALQRAGILEG
jgi:5'(3')-deoxyribonucleotidase